AVPLVPPDINEDFETLLEWADDARRLKVRANADNADDAAKAREFGAQGIGLCRTEHMFFGDERLPVVQEMILARDEQGRRAAPAFGPVVPNSARRGGPGGGGGAGGSLFPGPPRRSPSSCRRSKRRPTKGCGSGSRRSPRRIRCSARAAAGSASSGRRST